MGQLPTGVSVLTTVAAGDLCAMTAGSVVLASINPPLVAIFVATESSMHGHLLTTGRFTVSVLEAGDSLVARLFARRGRRRGWNGLDFVERDEGPPVLRGAISWLDCEVDQVTQTGDHSCFVGRVLAAGRRYGAPPLIYYRGRFHGLGSAVSPGMHLTTDAGDLLASW